jgi:hypothetical protein
MVIKWAKAQGFYEGEDPVELAEQALPRIKPSGEHFKSASYKELPQIVSQLQSSQVSLPPPIKRRSWLAKSISNP